MRRTRSSIRRFGSFAVFFALLPALLSAERPYLFVFHGQQAAVSVFDPESLEKIAAPRTAPGAFRAFALPGQSGTGGGAKFYVVSPGAVTVLDSGFRPSKTIRLPSPALEGANTAALSKDGRRLAVLAANGVYLIGADGDEIVAYLPLDGGLAGLLPGRDGTEMLVTAAGSPRAWRVDLVSDRLLDTPALLPVPFESWSFSADGSRGYALAGDGLYDLKTLEPAPAEPEETAENEPKLSAAGARRLAVGNRGRFYVSGGGRLSTGLAQESGEWDGVLGASGGAIRVDEKTWAVSPGGERVYWSEGGALHRIRTGEPESAASTRLSAAASGVEMAIGRVEQPGLLSFVTPNNMLAAGGQPFSITLRAAAPDGAPVSNLPVFLTGAIPANPAVSCLAGVTDPEGRVTLHCELGEVASAVNVLLTINDADGRSAPVYSLRARPPADFEGLRKISGDDQLVRLNQQFSVSVLMTRQRLPSPDETLTVGVSAQYDAVTCPATVRTGADGVAQLACRGAADGVPAATNAFITLTDDRGNAVVFRVVVDPFAGAPTGLDKISGDNQQVQQFQSLAPLVARIATDGEPQARVQVNVNVSNTNRLDCPVFGLTDDDGIVRVQCRARSLDQFESTSVLVQIAYQGRLLPQPFTVLVVRSTGPVQTSLQLLTPQPASGITFLDIPAAVEVAEAIRVRAAQGTSGAQGRTVYFWSDSGLVAFNPPVAETNEQGIAATSITVGCLPTGRANIFMGFQQGESLVSVTARLQPGVFSRLVKVQGDNQTGSPGQLLSGQALVARTTDACGNVTTMENVSWRVLPAHAAQLSNVVMRSDGAGRVSALVRLGSFGGPFQVEVAGGEASARFDLAVNAPATTLRKRSGDGQSAAGGQQLLQPLVVEALGAGGFGVAGVPVEFRVVSGPATVTAPDAMTNGAGIAFTHVRINQNAAVRVEASALGQTVAFNLNTGQAPPPQLTLQGFTNGASFATGWTPGALGTIFGSSLMDAAGVVAADVVPFPAELAGVRVTINGVPAPMISMVNVDGAGQINLQVPFEVQPGPATVAVNNNGRETTIEGVQIQAVQPGIFGLDLEGQRIAAALHQDFSLITPSNPARPGAVVQLYFTGAGPLQPPVGTNEPGPVNPLPITANPVTVRIDGAEVPNLGSFYAPGLVTANQVNFVLDSATPAGDRELTLTIDGVTSPVAILPVGN